MKVCEYCGGAGFLGKNACNIEGRLVSGEGRKCGHCNGGGVDLLSDYADEYVDGDCCEFSGFQITAVP